MKKIISIMLALVFSLFAVTPAYADDLYLIGDADGDSELTILDATHIQRVLAGLSQTNALRDYLSDVDGSGDATILDATQIQRRLAGIPSIFHMDVLVPWKACISRLDSDIADDTVIVGTEASFCIIEPESEIPSEHEAYINGIKILSRSTESVFSCTFAKEGWYKLSAIAYDPFGGADIYTVTIHAVSEPTAPEILSAKYIKSEAKIAVQASGGSAPYEYQYTIRNNVTPPGPDEVYTAEFSFDLDENGDPILICRFCAESEVYVPTYQLSKTLTYYCDVQVRGADGALSEIKKVQIIL